MPSGRTHDRITLWILPVVIGLTVSVTRDPVLITVVALAYLIGGFMLGPDLDIHSIQYKRWGPIRWIWLPYQIALPHRSRYSHGPLIGTALRVVYLGTWIALFVAAIALIMNLVWDAQLTGHTLVSTFGNLFHYFLVEWIAILVGLELGAMSHYISDMVGSVLAGSALGKSFTGKRKKRKSNRRKKVRKSARKRK